MNFWQIVNNLFILGNFDLSELAQALLAFLLTLEKFARAANVLPEHMVNFPSIHKREK